MARRRAGPLGRPESDASVFPSPLATPGVTFDVPVQTPTSSPTSAPSATRASNSARLGLMTDGLGELAVEGFGGLEAVAGDAEDGRAVAVDLALGEQLLEDGQRHAAGGLGEDALGLAEELHPRDDLVVATSSDQPPVSRISLEAK